MDITFVHTKINQIKTLNFIKQQIIKKIPTKRSISHPYVNILAYSYSKYVKK